MAPVAVTGDLVAPVAVTIPARVRPRRRLCRSRGNREREDRSRSHENPLSSSPGQPKGRFKHVAHLNRTTFGSSRLSKVTRPGTCLLQSLAQRCSSLQENPARRLWFAVALLRASCKTRAHAKSRSVPRLVAAQERAAATHDRATLVHEQCGQSWDAGGGTRTPDTRIMIPLL